MVDVLFVNPGNAKIIYQSLSNKYSAIEPPTWSLLLAQAVRAKGFNPQILDCNAEQLDNEEAFERIESIKPRLVCFVVYGQNVNSGTTNMSGAVSLSDYIKKKNNNYTISFVGSHVQALPIATLKKEKSIDFVFTNEGLYSLLNILKLKNFNKENLLLINGIAINDKIKPIINKAERVVPQERMDEDFPGYAWDLLPYNEKPFDLYRSPMWHAEYQDEYRSPYAALQTSLGCRFGCNFCMINIINRDNEDEIGVASKYRNMRYWSPEFIIKEFDKLINDYGVKTIRITDEMFLLNPKYYVPLCEMLKQRNTGDDLRMWAYSRIDTVKRKNILKLVRDAGIKWLCLGIESGEKKVRLEVDKGKFEDVDVKDIINHIHENDIQVMANYIFGLPGDNSTSIKKTFDLSVDLCTLGWNTYAAMALPGSKLYYDAILEGKTVPNKYEEFSFHSFNTLPLPTDSLSAAQILSYRDEAFVKYHTNNKFLNKVEKKFGKQAKENIINMTNIKLERKLTKNKNLLSL